jgi:hypothetical protein
MMERGKEDLREREEVERGRERERAWRRGKEWREGYLGSSTLANELGGQISLPGRLDRCTFASIGGEEGLGHDTSWNSTLGKSRYLEKDSLGLDTEEYSEKQRYKLQ